MRKIIILILIFLIGLTIGLLLNRFSLTGKAAEGLDEDYTYTRAICDKNNSCIDVLIVCSNGKVSKLEPSSNLIKLESDWEDNRSRELC